MYEASLFQAALCTQDSSTFSAPAGNGFSSMPGRHTFSKSEFIFSFPPMRLIGTFHNSYPFYYLTLQHRRNNDFAKSATIRIPNFSLFVKLFCLEIRYQFPKSDVNYNDLSKTKIFKYASTPILSVFIIPKQTKIFFDEAKLSEEFRYIPL